MEAFSQWTERHNWIFQSIFNHRLRLISVHTQWSALTLNEQDLLEQTTRTRCSHWSSALSITNLHKQRCMPKDKQKKNKNKQIAESFQDFCCNSDSQQGSSLDWTTWMKYFMTTVLDFYFSCCNHCHRHNTCCTDKSSISNPSQKYFGVAVQLFIKPSCLL